MIAQADRCIPPEGELCFQACCQGLQQAALQQCSLRITNRSDRKQTCANGKKVTLNYFEAEFVFNKIPSLLPRPCGGTCRLTWSQFCGTRA